MRQSLQGQCGVSANTSKALAKPKRRTSREHEDAKADWHPQKAMN
jgi:hypothetical protein